MVYHFAAGLYATAARTGVDTFEVDTGKVRRTVPVCGALWLTPHEGVAIVVRQATTVTAVPDWDALSIHATRVGVTRLC